MTHTLGPWLRDGRMVYALNEDGFNRFGASVQDPHTPEAELIAVATLMQAAPDLLEALEAIKKEAYQQIRDGTGEANKLAQRIWDVADAVLADIDASNRESRAL